MGERTSAVEEIRESLRPEARDDPRMGYIAFLITSGFPVHPREKERLAKWVEENRLDRSRAGDKPASP